MASQPCASPTDPLRPAGSRTQSQHPSNRLNTVKLLLALLLLAAPAAAQSIDPQAYGQRYCYLRGLGVAEDAARRAAVDYSWRPERSIALMKEDTMDAARYVVNNCPDNRIMY